MNLIPAVSPPLGKFSTLSGKPSLTIPHCRGGTPTEEIARQLTIRGYLQEEPSLSLLEEVLEVLEEGSIGLRSPTLQLRATFMQDLVYGPP